MRTRLLLSTLVVVTFPILALAEEPTVQVDKVRAVHYLTEGFDVETFTRDGKTGIMITNGGQVVVEREPTDPLIQLTFSEDSQYAYATFASGDECDWHCKCYQFLDMFWEKCNGLGCIACENCTLICPAPPKGPDPIDVANSPSPGINMSRYQ